MASVINRIVCEASSTQSGVDFLRRLPLTEVFGVKIYSEKGDSPAVTVDFFFKNGYLVTVKHAFGTGYQGEGPTGLYKILQEIGFDDDVAVKVFSKRRPEKLTR